MDPWLTIVGVGEDGPDGLGAAAREALADAEVVIGPPRHLGLVRGGGTRIPWPVPFADGLGILDGLRGRRVVALASGDPFWFGVGSVIAARYGPDEWRALPGVSAISLAAARMGWPLEACACLALHAAPLSRLRTHLGPGARILATLRDGPAVADLGAYLVEAGFGGSQVTVLEALGGPRERVRAMRAETLGDDHAHPVMVAVEPAGPALPLAPGRDAGLFAHDGQITKGPVRAAALAALAPRAGERLWDIGAGSGAVSVEWLMCHPSLGAVAVERDPARAQRVRANAATFGQDRLAVVEGAAPGALVGLAPPDAVFVGGGLSEALLTALGTAARGARIVAHAVTLESEALLIGMHGMRGGDLLRMEMARPAPIGTRRGWRAAYPVTQWTGIL